jgi:hypothetical protein
MKGLTAGIFVAALALSLLAAPAIVTTNIGSAQQDISASTQNIDPGAAPGRAESCALGQESSAFNGLDGESQSIQSTTANLPSAGADVQFPELSSGGFAF